LENPVPRGSYLANLTSAIFPVIDLYQGKSLGISSVSSPKSNIRPYIL
jgi:hypothetical protein